MARQTAPHPHQKAFCDTWALISYLAAQTRTVTFDPTVASLDVLTSGRLQLGLGAGAFWACGARNGPSA
ncbi:LLM class flavin-dependent oxidoreductase [Streptomyces olivochromogenes]|uniref:LLM class flavin-dependent oxidoreductase n=1 Tax=Streptomyces olivochromogenes TaxID=1963 RepID=UPI001F3B3C73|nr:LLM class flavin-dependent oxidoreductase [Streptomyces olivochromogenes]MCF3130488.1 hypothetical protein [Streptomyces olivochromogenes]